MNPIETLTDEALLLKLRSTEHDFVERKPGGQKGEWLQVAVAFANSAPIGWPTVLFFGVDDDGVPQQGREKLEDLSKSVAAVFEQAYPPIYFDIRPLHTDGGACLAVVIPGSESRPHFAGKAYTRVGPSVRESSEQQFAELIASHNSKAREILKRFGEQITWTRRTADNAGNHTESGGSGCVIGCNAHYVTMRFGGETAMPISFPLSRLELGFDHSQNRLQVFVYETR